jgi:hypothetical protein
MNCKKTSLLIISLFFFAAAVLSQDTIRYFDQVFGLDQTLHNGIKYTYAPPPGTHGHQYLASQFFSTGSVTIKGKQYNDVNLNFDILNQELLLKYADNHNPFNVIQISKSWLDGFRIGEMNFELVEVKNQPVIYQVIGEGPVRFLFFWRKSLDLDGAIGSYFYAYSQPVRDSYIQMKGLIVPFNSRNSFLKIFDASKRPEIKAFLRKNKINVRKATDQEMMGLARFIGNME